MRYLLLLACLTIVAATANAEIYQWTDKKGGINFTDNPNNIPPAYRNKAKEIDVAPSIDVKTPPQAIQAPVDSSPGDYGGHDEKWWRSSFRAIHEEISSIENRLPDKKQRLEELRRKRTLFQKPSDRVAYYNLMDEIKADEQRIAELRKKLDDLDLEASRAGVPLEWREK